MLFLTLSRLIPVLFNSCLNCIPYPVFRSSSSPTFCSFQCLNLIKFLCPFSVAIPILIQIMFQFVAHFHPLPRPLLPRPILVLFHADVSFKSVSSKYFFLSASFTFQLCLHIWLNSTSYNFLSSLLHLLLVLIQASVALHKSHLFLLPVPIPNPKILSGLPKRYSLPFLPLLTHPAFLSLPSYLNRPIICPLSTFSVLVPVFLVFMSKISSRAPVLVPKSYPLRVLVSKLYYISINCFTVFMLIHIPILSSLIPKPDFIPHSLLIHV